MDRPREQDVLLAASMYYSHEYTMDAVARRLGTSRSTVSRLLKVARAEGIVTIAIRDPQAHRLGVLGVIRDRFGIETHIVPLPDDASEVERLTLVATAAARVLGAWMDSSMVLGVAWGTTTTAISRELLPKPIRGAVVVQLNGAANTRTSGIAYAGALMSRFAEAFNASILDFPVPAFFDYPQTKLAMWRERSISRVLNVQAHADIAVFSVGAVAGSLPSHVYSAGYLEPADMQILRDEGVVGDVCTVFLRPDGSYADIELNKRATGPTPRQLAEIPRRLCVVAGDAKVEGLLAALRAGVATDLVVDERTASLLVQLMHSTDARPAD
ncbi:MAG: transcriptional regulator [Bifidobacteriaceae bacterium]|jgi:DNA-binding transcriptional regulator LsrR (DeoR family)|nr:transcriptional regulator [Bifidobacteriaceae bacterium]